MSSASAAVPVTTEPKRVIRPRRKDLIRIVADNSDDARRTMEFFLGADLATIPRADFLSAIDKAGACLDEATMRLRWLRRDLETDGKK